MMTAPDRDTPLVQPGEAVAEAGQVLLDGPDGVAVSLSPDAAEETGRRLMEAAALARQQGGAGDPVSEEGSA